MGKRNNKKNEKKIYSGLDSLADLFGLEKPKEKNESNGFKIVQEKKVEYVEKNPVKRTEAVNKSSINKPVNRNNNTYSSRTNDINVNKNQNNVPTAPYNFVPLNNIVVHPPLYILFFF